MICGLLPALWLNGCGPDEVELVGVVERRVLELAAPISEVIVDLPLAEGEKAQAGQIVVQLDAEVVSADLRAQEAAHAAASAQQMQAEGAFRRQEELRRSRVATQQALDDARRLRDEAAALVAEKEARIAQARKRLKDLTIRAHAAGVVDQLPFEVGERVPAGGVVAVVMAEDAPFVRVWLPARAVSRIAKNAPALVEVEGLAKDLHGHVTFVAREQAFTPHYALTERESAHLVYESRITLDDAPEDLRPGLPARIRVALSDSGTEP